MNGLRSDHMAWLHKFFSVCDECVDAGWDVEVHYEGEATDYYFVVGMYKNKIRSDEMCMDANDCRKYTKEEQEAEVERHIDSITVDTELTTQMAQNHQARKILADTDWYVVRKMETGKEIPDDIIDIRMKARSLVVNE